MRSIFLVGILVLFISSCAPLIENTYDIFDKDFLFDSFDTLNLEIWDKMNNEYYGVSQMRQENINVSNGYLEILISPSATDGGGIRSIKKFRYGKFSIYVINTNTNVVSQIEVNSSSLNLRSFLRYYFSEINNTNVVEFEIISPFTNIITSVSNSFQSNYTLLTIEVFPDSILAFFNGIEIARVSLYSQPKEVEVRINSYLGEYMLNPYKRSVFLDYFSYERN